MKILDENHVFGLSRYQMIREMNYRFYNHDYYKDGHHRPMLVEYEKNREIRDDLLQDVIQFCLSSDVCKTTGLTLQDLMNMDLHTYTQIKEAVRKENEEKSKYLEQQQKKTEERQNNLLKNK